MASGPSPITPIARRLSLPIMLRRLVLLLLVLAGLGGALLAADWWFCLPPGETARYVGRDECARCHEKETGLWTGSDHDRAMDPATPQTVLGRFDGRRFRHVPFEHLPRLADRDLQVLISEVDRRQWALAIHGAREALRAKVFANMAPEEAALLENEAQRLAAVRPCDVTAARDRIVQTVRRLEAIGRIEVPFGVTSRFFRREGKYYVTTDGPRGKMQTYRIKYVFGVRPLQQYLIEFSDGRVQCLGIAWDTQQRRWFHLYPAEEVPAGDQLHWTRPLQNWNYMCAECHSTNLQKDYRLETDTYHTTFSEIDVSCETCHGPGSLHVELADSWGVFWDRRFGYGLPSLKDADHRVEIETCAPCHSRRRVVYPAERDGRPLRDRYPLLDNYIPELLDGELYYADGQILEEDYVYGSYIQSKMYRKGVRCTDCHDPHTMRVKFTPADAPWGRMPSNRLCTQCHMGSHPAGEYDTPAHHYHPDSSQPGTKCVECHMPETSYMVVDPRRDHSMRVPRPDLTVTLSIPNACNGCHHDAAKNETPQWAEEQLRQWYGPRQEPPHFAYAIAHGRQGKPEGEWELGALIRRKDLSAAVRASALLLLARYPGGAEGTAARRALRDPDPLVRLAAVRSLQALPKDRLLRSLAPALGDPLRAVRTEAARVLSRAGRTELSRQDARAFEAALAEYLTGQRSLDDQPAAHLNMAVVYDNLGQVERAEQEYRLALRIDPGCVPARNNLAMLCNRLGRAAEAESHLRRVIELEPEFAEAHYSLGLLLAEDDRRLAEAAEALAVAARLAPENARVHYNYGLALQRLGRTEEAENSLRAAYKLDGGTPDYLHALAILYAQQKNWQQAARCAEELVRLWPENPQMRGLLEYVQRQSRAGGKSSQSEDKAG